MPGMQKNRRHPQVPGAHGPRQADTCALHVPRTFMRVFWRHGLQRQGQWERQTLPALKAQEAFLPAGADPADLLLWGKRVTWLRVLCPPGAQEHLGVFWAPRWTDC